MAKQESTHVYQVNYNVTTGKGRNRYTHSQMVLVVAESVADASAKFAQIKGVEPTSASLTNYEVIV